MGYCYNCRSWKQNKGTLEQQFFGECTNKHFSNMSEVHGMTNIDGAGFIGPNMDGVKYITGKKHGCRHFKYISLHEREGYVPPPEIKHEFLKVILTNSVYKTTHIVKTKDGKLNHIQVYNSKRVLCGDIKCPECDVAGCFPPQVTVIHKASPVRGSIYQINQKSIAEAVSRREGKQT